MRLAFAAAIAVFLTGCQPAVESVPGLQALDAAAFETLKADFNRAGDATRMVVLLSPT